MMEQRTNANGDNVIVDASNGAVYALVRPPTNNGLNNNESGDNGQHNQLTTPAPGTGNRALGSNTTSAPAPAESSAGSSSGTNFTALQDTTGNTTRAPAQNFPFFQASLQQMLPPQMGFMPGFQLPNTLQRPTAIRNNPSTSESNSTDGPRGGDPSSGNTDSSSDRRSRQSEDNPADDTPSAKRTKQTPQLLQNPALGALSDAQSIQLMQQQLFGMPMGVQQNLQFLSAFHGAGVYGFPNFQGVQGLPGNLQRGNNQVGPRGLGSTPPMPTATGAPSPATGRSISLYMTSDEVNLSHFQRLAREQIELFEATEVDAGTNAQGRNKPILLGQVGIRCKHCAKFPQKQRKTGSVYYPNKLDGVYQTSQKMIVGHLLKHCQAIPKDVRDKLLFYKDQKSSDGGGKRYWGDGARSLGVVETPSGGLAFGNTRAR